MSIIAANTKVYVFADAPIRTFEGGAAGIDEQDLPNSFGNTQNYYGETGGAAEQPIDKLWQPSSFMGTATGKTRVFNSVLYYQVAFKTTTRKGHGLGAGTYTSDIPRLCWASSAYLTDSESSGLEKFNKRTDGATKSQVMTANSNGKSDPKIGTGAGKDTPEKDKKNNNLLYGGIGLAVLGFCIWFFGFRKS